MGKVISLDQYRESSIAPLNFDSSDQAVTSSENFRPSKQQVARRFLEDAEMIPDRGGCVEFDRAVSRPKAKRGHPQSEVRRVDMARVFISQAAELLSGLGHGEDEVAWVLQDCADLLAQR
jgi:hypothetical protein